MALLLTRANNGEKVALRWWETAGLEEQSIFCHKTYFQNLDRLVSNDEIVLDRKYRLYHYISAGKVYLIVVFQIYRKWEDIFKHIRKAKWAFSLRLWGVVEYWCSHEAKIAKLLLISLQHFLSSAQQFQTGAALSILRSRKNGFVSPLPCIYKVCNGQFNFSKSRVSNIQSWLFTYCDTTHECCFYHGKICLLVEKVLTALTYYS